MSLITVVGMLGGLVIFLSAQRARKAVIRAVVDEAAGRIDAREAARIRFEHKRRSFRSGQMICVFLALLMIAIVGRAWVSGSWGGMTIYYVVLVGVLLSISAVTLWRIREELERSRAPGDT
ncbi:hypothetical protein [Nocardiopsis alkaliphila]|uniref:hypothetical protein n=1 Tax=Nocardiopsis alkaliphila TaxID=225762 RepID=UPI000477D123|nr:hypothetical protein [Nocardiopsis alkaliphila]